MIYIRDDDVLVPSKSTVHPFEKFRKFHSWLCESPRLLHIPTILVTEIQQFPEAVEFVRAESAEGRMKPQLHGYQHIDYGKLAKEEIREHLERSLEWWEGNIGGPCFDKWYTPWGANSVTIREAADEFKLQIVDCSQLILLEKALAQMKKRGGPAIVNGYEERELFWHWWQQGLRPLRLAMVTKYGSWERAESARPELFR